MLVEVKNTRKGHIDLGLSMPRTGLQDAVNAIFKRTEIFEDTFLFRFKRYQAHRKARSLHRDKDSHGFKKKPIQRVTGA